MVHREPAEAAAAAAAGGETSISTQPPSSSQQAAPPPAVLVYKVGYPPRRSLATELTSTLRETFFHDSPLKQCKDQSGSTKLQMGLQLLFPVLGWGRTYSLSMFKGDLVAGLTIASLCIPQVLPVCAYFLSVALLPVCASDAES